MSGPSRRRADATAIRCRAALLAAALALVGAGCAGSGGGDAPDVDPALVEHVSDRQLALMPLPKPALGATASGLRLGGESGITDSFRAANSSLDPTDRPADVAAAGRIRGATLSYSDPRAPALTTAGLVSIETSADLFATPEQAAAYETQLLDDWERFAGAEVDAAVRLVRTERFEAPGIGEQADGTVAEFRIGSEAAWTTVVVFRLGRILGGAAATRADRKDAQEETRRLARALERRILAVLAGKVGGEPLTGSRAEPEPLALPPKGTPDVAPFALQAADLPEGSRVGAEAFVPPQRGIRASFRRQFQVGSALIGDARVFGVQTSVDLYRSRADAQAGLLLMARASTSEVGPQLLAQLFGGGAAFTNGRVVEAKQIQAGEGAIAVRAEFESAVTRVGGVVVFVAVDRLVGTVVVTAPAERLDLADVTPLAKTLGRRLAGTVKEEHVAN